MGTTRIKVIDLSSEQKEIKTSRKHAEKLTSSGKLKAKKKPEEEKPITESMEKVKEGTESSLPAESSVPSAPSVPSVIHKQSGTLRNAKTNQRHRGKKYQQALSIIDKDKIYTAKEAIELLNKTSFAKFDPTVEIHFNVTDKNIKGSITLPYPTSKIKRMKRYLIFTDKQSLRSSSPQDSIAGLKKPITESTEKRKKSTKSSVPSDSSVPSVINIIWGSAKTIEEIQNGSLRPGRDFDAVITQPKFMPNLVKIAKILGPRGMMPNPKDKTITENPLEALENQASQKDSHEYKTDPGAPVIHSVLGKLSAKPDQLSENLKSIVLAIGPTKIKKATIKSSMSPAISLDITSFAS